MHDLIGAYQRVDRLYRLYIKSAFPLRSSVLSEERDNVLAQKAVLSQPPLVETIPIYPTSSLNLEAATMQLHSDYSDLSKIAQKLFPPHIELYRHQWDSLQKVISERKDIVVTTGTGSGKTEAFLLPLFAQLARESAKWVPIGVPDPKRQWWNTRAKSDVGRVSQWEHTRRPSALRAMILYPLNALVEDQLRRLRMAIDDNDVHAWLNQERGGNRITFGRYTGLTHVAGPVTNDRVDRLSKELREIDQQRQDILNTLQKNPASDRDIQYYFPRLDGGEMWSRWDMQETPPDILITNYSMLNIMLMRSIENNIFETTKAWLAEKNHPEREFFLIVDELHAYRGTPGTEVAYILRLLLQRLGLTPDSPKLRILTTTASLDNNDEGKRFLREFFGRDQFEFISQQQTPPRPGSRTFLMPHQRAFEDFAHNVQPNLLDGPPDIKRCSAQIDQLSTLLGQPFLPGKTEVERLGEALVRIRASDALRDACLKVNGSVRPTQAPDLDKQLFSQTGTNSKDALVSDAMRGLMLAVGMSRQVKTGRSVQPVRGHLFFHHLQNLWACCNFNCTDSSINRQRRENALPTHRPTVGAIYVTHRIACSCGARVLDLIVCEVCGDVLLGGHKATKRFGKKKLTTLTADQPDLENIPDRVDLTQRYEQYAVFWPLPYDYLSVRPVRTEWTVEKIRRKWVNAKLNHATGEIVQDATPPEQDEIPGWLYQVPGAQSGQEPSLPTRCPRCDADYRRKKTFKSPLRNHRTGFQKACQVISSALFREMDSDDTNTSWSRKLVIFSDSRQDAAKLAAGMERDHFRDAVRLVLMHAFHQYWDELVSYVRTMSARHTTNLPILEALNPSLYKEVTKPLRPEDTLGRSKFAAGNARIINEALLWFMGEAPDNPEIHEQWMALLQTYPNRIPLANLRGTIRDKLLELGICPGGSTYEAKGYGPSSSRQPWFTCYSWDKAVPIPVVNQSQLQSNHISRMEDILMRELMYALFPHMARTLEGLGQGWVSYHPYENPSPDITSATEATIRQMGIRRTHRYLPFPQFVDGKNDELGSYAEEYLFACGLSDVAVRQQLLRSSAAVTSEDGLALSPDNLTLMLPPPFNDDGTRPGYRCPRCNAFYLHNAKYCPECADEAAIPLVVSKTASDFDYYTDLTERQNAVNFRMNCEELTGQTDSNDRPKRQRWFQNIFIEGENPKVLGVDLLSVTTTMEAGVDIGALNSVMMANMPPRRFNYQQRVGRAGRRGSGVSLAVTFCRGRSHDDFYYLRPEIMTGDSPPTPYVDMKSLPIYRRVLVKEVLRQAFITVPLNVDSKGDSVHGEFGPFMDWRTYAPDIDKWLHDPLNQSTIDSIIQALCLETPWSSTVGGTFHTEMIDYLHNTLLSEIEDTVDNPSYTQDALSERLANAGLLPMFGFPTRVRSLYTRWPSPHQQWPPESGTVDRDLDVAISQFAPGSQIVKDKAVHTSVGVVNFIRRGNRVLPVDGFAPPLSQINQTPIGFCEHCQAVVAGSPLVSIPKEGEEMQKEICPVCQFSPPSLRVLDVREPQGFFTDLTPEDFDGQFEWQPRSTRPSLGIETPTSIPLHINNSSIRTFSDHVLTLNDNGGQGGFNFRDTKVFTTPRPEAHAVSPTNSAISSVNVGSHISLDGPSRHIALISRRVTDILLVGINAWPTGIFADPTTVVGRAAWYSFAFWLRIAAAAQLDVDALELQAGFRSVNGTPPYQVAGEAFLCDQLENGAGYCRHLGQKLEFEKLIDQIDYTNPNSISAKWADPTILLGSAISHSLECDTSCNRCLRDFQNLPYHGLLDWRLALDMVRLMASPSSIVDLNTSWSNISNPWILLTSRTDAPVPSIMKKLYYSDPTQFGQLRGYVHQSPKRKEILIERHPLWQDNHPEWLRAKAEAETLYSGYTIADMNPFIVLRRPADYA